MSTPKSRARWVRGALVGASSAVVTTGAHSAAGGGMPRGAALLIALLVCAAVGALCGCARFDGRASRPLSTAAALGAAQLLGHVSLAMAGGHHHGGDWLGLSPSMLATHAAAAVLLAVAITAVEHLYVVCCSVLCWLRLFAISAAEPVSRPSCRMTSVVVARPVLHFPGLGMRAPPRLVSATA
ncbi:hypothetical protein [Mycolicibacterium sp. YH-1]|uniref:hypothetical protein n=1 Tax=Mycolicibacterium sp. YH-1 TaxID=2908837 RepID=UPI001F4C34F6|nr:hypothetical protein [Mycolicibacterium sp. YH-1]UNB52997.1 hypothetical protein L0M16_01025 [Mycolicibacterium sp. YH-1]